MKDILVDHDMYSVRAFCAVVLGVGRDKMATAIAIYKLTNGCGDRYIYCLVYVIVTCNYTHIHTPKRTSVYLGSTAGPRLVTSWLHPSPSLGDAIGDVFKFPFPLSWGHAGANLFRILLEIS